ncbi:hypothetical protein N7510_006237 [Penicillium lagena]|uniref:uncharacterized protein n=1 Tax=Penicillium lagena TaxID=94218 RepID=UPI0025402BB6|nr:uncharacterized protein N7510_006237 [Penicillium lagena]KAJ5613043.1 hypothetical protein N7510_006237 [Penicillium lagena]
MDQDDLDDLNDPDLKAAIEASLRDTQRSNPSGESSSRVTHHSLVDLTADSDDESDVKEVHPKSKSLIGSETEDEAEEDEDDEELKRALAMSLEKNTKEDVSQAPIPSATEKISTMLSNASAPNVPVASKPSGILGLNRKQMEEERLARLKKRKADDGSSPLPESESKVPRTEPVLRDTAIPFSSPTLTSTPPSNICQSTAANSSKFGVQPTARPVPQWPLGAVKKTHVSGIPRKGDDITIEEVFQRADLELAVLSSFMWDMEWLFSKLDTQRTRFIFVMQAKEEETKLQYQQETSDMPNLKLCFPPMDGQINCMHSKLMLLFHREYLRIVVPTANLTTFDWGENGLMENSAFLIDLPKKSDDISSQCSKTAFYEELVYFLKAMTLHENVISKLDSFDFSKTARYAFVHTVGGSHTGDSWKRTGHCGLGRAVARLGLQSPKPINIEFVATDVFRRLSDRGIPSSYLPRDDGLTEYIIRNTKASAVSSHPRDPEKKITKETGKEWRDRFRVYFPSDQTVRRAHSNPAMTAGTICFQSRWWQGAKFPRHVMRDCESERGSVLMHNKIIYVSPVEAIILPDETQFHGWAYVGSANLSESAWGRLVKDRGTGQPKLNCRNWECGVVVPITETDLTTQGKQGMMNGKAESSGYFPAGIFRDTVPVVMKTPARQLKEGLDPWFFMG